jgi:hydroxymethylpyrimidine pyrophosphatase-like HAD family hydrolase
MRNWRVFYIAVATDYDGTIAEDGRVNATTLEALDRLKETGRHLILLTGRELPDLIEAFPENAIFDRIVAENGALLYCPATMEERGLSTPPDEKLVGYLRSRNVTPLSVGRSIIATRHPNETIVLEGIEELGVETQITFNKGAVMVLASGVNKSTGLAHALADLNISPVNVLAIGDAENDIVLLRACGCGVAVANALPTLKSCADYVTEGARGAGVVEVISRLIECDANAFPKAMDRHRMK